MNHDNIIIAVTGASGTIYAERFLETALQHYKSIDLLFSETAVKVARYELAGRDSVPFSLLNFLSSDHPHKDIVSVHKNKDMFSCLASGSSAGKTMVIVPCSMGTLGRISAGLASTLIERTADVVLKEKNKLVICPRETPFNSIHLENMLKLDRMGAHIVPPSPGFYQRPKSIDDLINFSVGKLFDALRVDHKLYKPWKAESI